MTWVDVFQAVADPVRRSMIERLAEGGDVTAGTLADLAAARFGIRQPAASKHLRVLRDAGVVRSRVDAQRRLYRLEPTSLDQVAGWVARQTGFWTARLDALDQHLDQHERGPDEAGATGREA